MKISRTVILIAAAVALLVGLTLRPTTAPVPAPAPAPVSGLPAASIPVTAPLSVPVTGEGTARTTPRELAAMMKRGEVLVIDVRDADAYISGHIEGALHIPLSYIAGEVPYLRKGKPIVTYCT